MQNLLSTLESVAGIPWATSTVQKKLSPIIALHFKVLCESKSTLPLFPLLAHCDAALRTVRSRVEKDRRESFSGNPGLCIGICEEKAYAGSMHLSGFPLLHRNKVKDSSSIHTIRWNPNDTLSACCWRRLMGLHSALESEKSGVPTVALILCQRLQPTVLECF